MIPNERTAIRLQIAALQERLRKLDSVAPEAEPALAVGFLAVVLLQGFHEAEHVAQILQRFVLDIPGGNGLLGAVFDLEPLHLAYNLSFLWLLVLVYHLSGATRVSSWSRGTPAWCLLTAAVGVQTYHVVEHLFKIAQFVDEGRNGTPGILGNAFNLVWLHFTFNTLTYVPVLLAFFVGGFHRRTRIGLVAAWADLRARSAERRAAGAPVLSRRALLGGVAGLAVALGAARVAVQVRRPLLRLPTFVDVAAEAGLTFRHQAVARADNIQAGVAFFDFDGDGRPDIFLTNAGGANALYRNNGDGTFADVAAMAGVADPDGVAIGVACADYDNDGHCDLLVTRMDGLRLFHNNGDGTFTDLTVRALLGVQGGHPASAAWADFDGDGYLDLYVTYWLDEMLPIQPGMSPGRIRQMYAKAARSHRLFHNEGDGTFRDVTAYLGTDPRMGAGLGVGFFDYDGDGRPDLYVVNDFGRHLVPNVLYRNEGPLEEGWGFRDVAKSAGVDAAIHGMGLALGDYDGDGRPDMYVTNMGSNLLYRNRGDGRFEETTNRAGVGRAGARGEDSVGWGAGFLDFDNDGWLDLYFVAGSLDPVRTDGRYPSDQPNALFHNRGDGSFRDVSKLTGTDDTSCARGLAIADVDGDGFLDLLVANYDQPPVLLRNYGNGNRWLQVRLVGTRGNRDGIGARLALKAGGRQQVREIRGGTSFLSQHSLVAHFGLGQLSRADELTVRWPSGVVQTLTDIAADQQLTVPEAV